MTRVERAEAGLSVNRILIVVLGGIWVVAGGLMGIRHVWLGTGAPETLAASDPGGSRSTPPAVGGLPLELTQLRPPPPAQWDGGPGGVPFASWWSSLVTGGGSEVVWANPLAVLVDGDGLVAVDAPEPGPDGASFDPDLYVELAAAPVEVSVSVVEYGDFHVTARFGSGSSAEGSHRSMDLTLVQGSPFLEMRTDQALTLVVPGLSADTELVSSEELAVGQEPPSTSLLIGTPGGLWVVASDRALIWSVDHERLSVSTADGGPFRLVLGPGFGDETELRELALAAAAHPVAETMEGLSVGPDGSVSQSLEIRRDGGAESVFALMAHQTGFGASGHPIGRWNGPLGSVELVRTSRIEMDYPPAPVIWDPVGADWADPDLIASDLGQGAEPHTGSYFGGKEVLRLAQVAQVASASGWKEEADHALDRVESILADMASPGGSTSIRWEPTWGSVVVEPAEFGLGTQLNDHSLQYGYWVDAASILRQHRGALAPAVSDAIDLMIADYGGTRPAAGSWGGLAPLRTWSPYEGHSWASGTAPFAAGNNLESISESTHAWWAAARWYAVTGRGQFSDQYLARFTIETHLAGGRWLPVGDTTGRPWSGVVWSSRSDDRTWFDDRPEAALGIRLLPLGPASLARYGTAEQRAAATSRWDWCESYGGCLNLWPNLLDSDAAVGGREALPVAGELETSTPASVSSWWRSLWSRDLVPASGWRCGAGVVVMEGADGGLLALGSNPADTAVEVECRNGNHLETIGIQPGASIELELPGGG